MSRASSPPEIAHVWPDFISTVPVPHVLTGEGFDEPGLALWTWEPPADPVVPVMENRGQGSGFGEIDEPDIMPRPLPERPPAGALRVEPLDVERQVIVARLTGTAVWVETKAGWSTPCRLNAPRIFWLSQDAAFPGAWLHLCGFGLRREHEGFEQLPPVAPDGEILLKNADHSLRIRTQLEGRSTQWVGDSHLLYFRLPVGAPAGEYEVWLHNGRGGAYGWVRAGSLTVRAGARRAPPVFNALDYGARGDGIVDDGPALKAALEAAAPAGGVVALPPGTYRIHETLLIPAGVTLRGAGHENTCLEGAGYDPAGGPPAAVLRLTDRTAVHALTISGAVGAGLASVRHPRSDMSMDAMIRLEPSRPGRPVEDVGLFSCRIRALEETPDTRDPLYLKAIQVGPDHYGRCRRVTLNNNEIHGSFFFWRGERLEIIRNTWLHGAATIVVVIHGWAVDSLLDANIFRDTPGRLCFYPLHHCYLRFNEIHGAFRGSWANAEEVYLLHGRFERYFEKEDHRRITGRATGGSRETLEDSAQKWTDDEHLGAIVLITEGRGFGQYRRVVGNTASALTVDAPWRVEPDATTRYLVGWMYCENAFYANLNDTPLRMSFWYDAIGNVVERHRDEFSKGIDIQGGYERRVDKTGLIPDGPGFHPSWYNIIANGWLDGAAIELHAYVQGRAFSRAPSLFATAIVSNQIRQPHAFRTGKSRPPVAAGGVLVGQLVRPQEHSRVSDLRPGDISHTLIQGNHVGFTPIGIHIGNQARKTFVLNNRFQQVESPVLDGGAATLMIGNCSLAVARGSYELTEITREPPPALKVQPGDGKTPPAD